MDTKLLEDFLSLARSKNFSRSAEERFVTQPAFSRRIKALENWAGTPLIDRDSYPAELTPAGAAFRSIAEKILRQFDEGRDEINEIGWVGAMPIQIISAHALSLNFFPSWLNIIGYDCMLSELCLIPDDLYNCIESLIQGDVDFMSVYSHQSSPILIDDTVYPYRVIGYDHYYPVSVTDRNGEAKFQFPGTQYSPIPFLAYPASIFLGKVILPLLQNTPQTVHLKRVFENPMANGLKSMVLEGYGVAWLPESIIRDELKSNKLKILGDESLATKLEIRLYRGNIDDKPLSKSLWQKVIENDISK